MANFKQYTIDEMWRPPDVGDVAARYLGNPPPPPRPAASDTGCPFMDAFCAAISGCVPPRVVAARIGVDAKALAGAVETLTGMTIIEWIDAWMMRDAEWLLVNTLLPVGEIGRRMGYATPSNFGHAFRRRRRMSPGEYRLRHGRLRRRTVTVVVEKGK